MALMADRVTGYGSLAKPDVAHQAKRFRSLSLSSSRLLDSIGFPGPQLLLLKWHYDSLAYYTPYILYIVLLLALSPGQVSGLIVACSSWPD